MSGTVDFVMVLHNHQPVGNFEHVLEEAYNLAYRPFLEVFDRECLLPLTLHVSGCLLEWLAEHHGEYLDRLKGLVGSGRVELLGGGMYEPILTGLPRRDALAQLRLMRAWLEERFDAPARGAWLAERVWESGLASVLAEAGVEYLTLDDCHFRWAGLAPEELHRGPYLVEDEGRLVSAFPAEERLRYLIPFALPEETIKFLRAIAEATPTGESRLLVYADDGEKFGSWPQTHDWVYRREWLKRFFAALAAERDWLRVITLAEAHVRYAPAGRIYLPDASYREMTEWALPARTLPVYEQVRAEAQGRLGDETFAVLGRFLRAGQWRNFRVKYAEANRLYAKLRLVSDRVAAAAEAHPRDARLAEARRALYRGQCNCPYWHGIFGGLYLPHLRTAVYRELLRAERLADEILHAPPAAPAAKTGKGRAGRARSYAAEWVERRVGDFDLDGHPEVILSSRQLSCTVAPHRGGHLYQLDLREQEFHLTDTLTRRYEAYHAELVRQAQSGAAGTGGAAGDGPATSIHELLQVKEAGLAERLVYDDWTRECLIDHFFPGGEPPAAEELAAGRAAGEAAWRDGPTECDLESPPPPKKGRKGAPPAPMAVGVRCVRAGRLGGTELRLIKTVRLAAGERRLVVGYQVLNLAGAVEAVLGVEFNLTLLAGRAPDRYYYTPDERPAGDLSLLRRFGPLPWLGLRDEWQKIDVRLVPSAPAEFAVYPVETVSRSESGIERVYQGSCVMPLFRLKLPAGGLWSAELVLEIEM